jgi:hypothetical protein
VLINVVPPANEPSLFEAFIRTILFLPVPVPVIDEFITTFGPENLEDSPDVEFKYKILSENFNINFLKFQIKTSLEGSSIKDYSLSNSTSNILHSANFNFYSNPTGLNYYLVIQVNDQNIIDDFEIEIPSIVRKKVSKKVNITLEFVLK